MRTGGWRRGAAGGALLCHLLTTFGFPLPLLSAGTSKDGSRPFPCQSRPCGCLTYNECWKGDCCCFTIEEKLHWAEENGIEPPGHARALVESRKSRPAPPPKIKPPYRSESEPTHATAAPCCEARKPASTRGAGRPSCAAVAAADGPACPADSASECCEQTRPRPEELGARWVAGVFAQKCRGHGPAALLMLDPAVVPDLSPIRLDPPNRDRHPSPRSNRAVPVAHAPPTPPPRD
ncbi:hypothetical protein FTUN_8948 [Frigoriglobus tundricola]|uniref:Uncharacterized protein n=1 Tax=Frigoriglobus tundricola TaxID=2774151 RepID=A0A6M5Z7E1_9BACT|nr:hypothetical protein FTUN_8948 [Frigoriglobus tundricola]